MTWWRCVARDVTGHRPRFAYHLDAQVLELVLELIATHHVVDVNGQTRVVSFDTDGKMKLEDGDD